MEPQNLYLHVNDKQLCDRRLVVKDFCFIDGIKVKLVNTIEELESLLYNTFQPLHFAFTLNSADDGDQHEQFES